MTRTSARAGSHPCGSRMIVSFTRSHAHGLTAKREDFIPQSCATRMATTIARENTGVAVKREESPHHASDLGLAIPEYQDPTAGTGVSMISNHPELETIVRAALDHMLLGSRPRGTRVSGGFAEKALTKMAPAVFDTDRLRVSSPASPVPVKALLTLSRESLPGCR